MPKRIRHCTCFHVPERAEQLLADLRHLDLSVTQARALERYLYDRAAPRTHLHDRALRHVSSPDAHGHQRWTGPHPVTGGQVRIMQAGRRLPVTTFLWLLAGGVEAPLVRTCHDPQCIAPSHHALATEPREQTYQMRSRELDAFDALNPKVNYRPKRWNTSTDPYVEGDFCPAGHPLRVYDRVRRSTYCRLCAKVERARDTRRRALVRELEDLMRGKAVPLHEPQSAPAIDLDAEPTLVELLTQGSEHVQP